MAATGLAIRNDLVKRAKAAGIPANGSNDELAAAVAAAEANQGGSNAPAEDPTAAQAAPGEAGPPPSIQETPAPNRKPAVPLTPRPNEALEVAQPPEDGPGSHSHKQVTRTSSTAWWCPVCDNSQLLGEPRCFKCGFAPSKRPIASA